jgi:hypothetical protein
MLFLEGAQSEQVVQAGSPQRLALVLKRNSRPQQVDHIPKISLHKSNIEQQHRPILDQPPAGLDLR